MGHASAASETDIPDTAGVGAVLDYLRAVVAASECLVAEPDLQRGVASALEALRTLTRLDRVYVFRDVPGAGGVVLFGESHNPQFRDIRSLFGSRVFRDGAFAEVMAPLRAGKIYQSIHPQRIGENADVNDATDTRSDLMVPVLVDGTFWGLVGFDDCRFDRSWSAAEVQALQGAASAIAAAVQRAAAMAERQRDNQHHEGLLRASSEACQHLAAEPDLQAALQQALDALRLHSGADRVFLNRYAPAERATYFWLESRHHDLVPFVTGFGPGPWPDDAYAHVTGPLLQGHVYRSLAAERSGESALRNEINGSLSDLVVPILVDGRYQACLGFDDHHSERVWGDADVAVLQTVAAAIASAMQRHAATAVRERERLRYEALLRAVAAASQHLVAASDLYSGLHVAMEVLGGHAGHSRAYTFELSSDQKICTLVAEWEAPGIPKGSDVMGTTSFAVAKFTEVWTPLLAGRHYQSVTPAKSGQNAELNEAIGNRSDVMVPVFVDGRCWGCIGFDNCHDERAYSSAEIDALAAAANAVAAAIGRHQAVEARLASERLRADETLQVNRLLEGVVAASRALLDDDDFDAALQRWLAFLATAVEADRAMYGDYTQGSHVGSVAAVHFDWTRPGLQSTQDDNIPQSTDFVEWTERLARGETIWAHRDELRDPASVDYWESTSCWTNLIVPVVVERRTVGWLCFDFQTRREWKPALGAVLRTAADGAAAAIKRRWAVQAMLAERDRRTEAERLRADESARHAARTERHSALLAAVAASAEELLATRDPGQCLDAVLQRVGQLTNASRAFMVRADCPPEDTLSHGWNEVIHEWSAPGAVRRMDIAMSHLPMRRSDPTWADLFPRIASERRIVEQIEALGEPFRSEQQALGVVWWLVYPIMVDEKLWGLLGFDYATAFEDYEKADLDALQTVASTIADALTRQRLEERAVAVERRRADENARLADLLGQVVRSSRALIDAGLDGFEPALLRWLGSYARSTDAIRSSCYDLALHEESGMTTVRVLCDWVREGVGGNLDVSFDRPYLIDPRGAVDMVNKIVGGHAVAVHTDETMSPMREFLHGQGIATVVMAPIFLDGVQWGCLSFDYAQRSEPTPSDFAVLQTAADTLAAVLKRNGAVRLALEERDRRIVLELQASEAERKRADENARLASLLANVVQSSRLLIDAGLDDLEPALLRWLGMFGSETRATRATLYDLAVFQPTGQPSLRMLCEWVRDGIEGSIPVSFEHPFVIDPRGAEDLFERLMSGRPAIFHTPEISGPVHDFLVQQGNASVVAVPVFIDGRQWGCLSFDHAQHHDPEAAMVTVLQTAADTLAAVLKRNEAARLALQERDLRIELEQRSLGAERARAHALRTANDELIASMSRLVALQDLPAFLGQLLLALTRTCRARTGSLLAFDGVVDLLWMRHCVIDGELVDVRTDPRLAVWQQPVPDVAVNEWRRNLAGQVVTYHAVPISDEGSSWPQGLQWHRDMGHRLCLHFPLNIGGQLVGIAGLLMNADEMLDEFQLQQAVVLAQQAAIAMQMERLARLVESSAVRTERERMAAEIHDNLAQSFTSIAMQSESLAGLLGADQDKARVLRLIERTAREGLAEARMSVLALLPADGWPGSLDQSLAALAERSSIQGGISCRFESKGIPCAMPGPVQESLLRIAQEATSNAMRHSGGTQVVIRLDYVQQRLRLTIEDDGHGLPSPDRQRRSGGFGVTGMESRAAAIGGKLSLGTSTLGGLAVTIDVPCNGLTRVGGQEK